MTPLKIGAALKIEDIAAHRDWLFDAERDLEVQDFIFSEVYREGWQAAVDLARAALDGFGGRLGIHGPFIGLDIAAADPDAAEVIGRRYAEAVDAAAALGAGTMVVHSPFDNWSEFNRLNFGDLVTRAADDVHRVLGTALQRAETEGVTLVVENIKDITPAIRREMVERIGSKALALSIDTGHAAIAERASGAPPVDVFVRDAGALLRHVHLQDTDGYADRHWAPGEGRIPWAEVFRALSDAPSAPLLVLELRRHGDIPAGFGHLRDLGLAV